MRLRLMARRLDGALHVAPLSPTPSPAPLCCCSLPAGSATLGAASSSPAVSTNAGVTHCCSVICSADWAAAALTARAAISATSATMLHFILGRGATISGEMDADCGGRVGGPGRRPRRREQEKQREKRQRAAGRDDSADEIDSSSQSAIRAIRAVSPRACRHENKRETEAGTRGARASIASPAATTRRLECSHSNRPVAHTSRSGNKSAPTRGTVGTLQHWAIVTEPVSTGLADCNDCESHCGHSPTRPATRPVPPPRCPRSRLCFTRRSPR